MVGAISSGHAGKAFYDGLVGAHSGREPCALVLRGKIVLAGESDLHLSALGN